MTTAESEGHQMRNAVEKRRRGACRAVGAALFAIPLVLGFLWEASAATTRSPLRTSDLEALAFDPFSLTTDQGLLSALLNSTDPAPTAGPPSGGSTLGAESRTLTVVRAALLIARRPPKRTPVLPPWP